MHRVQRNSNREREINEKRRQFETAAKDMLNANNPKRQELATQFFNDFEQDRDTKCSWRTCLGVFPFESLLSDVSEKEHNKLQSVHNQ